MEAADIAANIELGVPRQPLFRDSILNSNAYASLISLSRISSGGHPRRHLRCRRRPYPFPAGHRRKGVAGDQGKRAGEGPARVGMAGSATRASI